MRRRPYTDRGIRRLKCFRYEACGNRASAQWQICADGSQYRPICRDCDIELNRLVLEWMGFPDVDAMIDRYTRSERNASPIP